MRLIYCLIFSICATLAQCSVLREDQENERQAKGKGKIWEKSGGKIDFLKIRTLFNVAE
jgi:hypothetical protein